MFDFVLNSQFFKFCNGQGQHQFDALAQQQAYIAEFMQDVFMIALSFGWVLDPGVTDYGDTPSDP
ncbi:MAG: hypothetical protein ACLGGW_11430, partial [Gammaproteobacteria bacterium]